MPTNLPSTSTNHLVDKFEKKKNSLCCKPLFLFLLSVEDMIKEVDVDGDGRIDFYGKISSLYITTTRENAKIKAG